MRSILHESMLGLTERPAPVAPARVPTPLDDLLDKEAALLRQLDLVRIAMSKQLREQRTARGLVEHTAASLAGVAFHTFRAMEHYGDHTQHAWKHDAAVRLAQCYVRVAVTRPPAGRWAERYNTTSPTRED